MKLLLADDDLQILEGIKEGIDWNSLGIDEVITASNGIEALESYSKYLPEIVITDIRMPGIDGLELFEHITKINPMTKVVIISAYSDFEYLKKSIQLGVVDYELKPIKVRNLINLVMKLKDDILKEKVSDEKFRKYLESYKKSFIVKLLEGKEADRNIILEGLNQYFKFDGNGLLLCISLEIDSYRTWALNSSEIELLKPCKFIKDFIENNFSDTTKALVYEMSMDKFVIIVKTVDSVLFNINQSVELRRCVIELNSNLEAEIGMSVSAGISTFGNISEISKLYNQSKMALQHKLYSGRKSFNIYSESYVVEKSHIVPLNVEDLQDVLRTFDFNSISKMICDEFDKLKVQNSYSKNSIANFCTTLINSLEKILKDYIPDIEGLNYNISGRLEDTMDYETLDDYREYVLNIYKQAFDEYIDINAIKCSTLIQKTIMYIKKNYQNDLTTELVANYVGKTPNYFSHLFKKELGISFSEYLNRVRISKAKELILNSNLLIYEIGEKVGYHDYFYFSQVFKRIEGYPPTEYRK